MQKVYLHTMHIYFKYIINSKGKRGAKAVKNLTECYSNG